MSFDRLSHIHYEMHMLMSPNVVTFDCEQYLQQLMISESLTGVYHEGVSSASSRTSIFDVSHDRKSWCAGKKTMFFLQMSCFNIFFTSFYIVQEPRCYAGFISGFDLFNVYL